MNKYFFTFLIVLLPAVFGYANVGSDNGMDSMDTGSMEMVNGNTMSAPAAGNFYSTEILRPHAVNFTDKTAAAKPAAKGPTVYFFVQIDTSGKRLAVWVGSSMVDDLLSNIVRTGM